MFSIDLHDIHTHIDIQYTHNNSDTCTTTDNTGKMPKSVSGYDTHTAAVSLG